MPNVEHSFVLYALLLEPGGCPRVHITLFELVEPGPKKKKKVGDCGWSRCPRNRVLSHVAKNVVYLWFVAVAGYELCGTPMSHTLKAVDRVESLQVNPITTKPTLKAFLSF